MVVADGIRITELSKSYDGKAVLDTLSLDIPYGDNLCLMGPSGCGKTTLLHILMGFVHPDNGTITGLENRRLAPVFQEDRLCENLSAGANLRLVCPKKLSPVALLAALEAVGLADSLHKPVHQLSGGMRRRVGIARALISGGDVLLLDEPFKGLDDDTREAVMLYVKQASTDKTLIWVTHDEREVAFMGSRIVRLGTAQ